MNKKIVLTLVGVVLSAGAMAQPAQPAPAAPPAEAPAQPAIEPEAMEALNKMGAFLRAQQTFQVQAKAATDDVLPSGQKVELAADIDLKVRRPDRLTVQQTSDRQQRQFFYDGKTFSLYTPKLGYYSTIEAPPTLRQLIELLTNQYGVELPLADLFLWGTEQSGVRDIKSATYIGPGKIEGADCDHYAFRQDEVDWQLWIQKGDKPLPRKLVITTTSDASRPDHTATYKWNLSPRFEDKVFTFVPPKDAHRIEFEQQPAGIGRRD